MRLLGFIVFTLTVALQISASNSDDLRKPLKRRGSSEMKNLDEEMKRMRMDKSSNTVQASGIVVKDDQGFDSNGQRNLSQNPTSASNIQLGDDGLKKKSPLKRMIFTKNEEDNSDGIASASKSFKPSNIVPCLPSTSSNSSEFKRKLSEESEPTNDDSERQQCELLPSEKKAQSDEPLCSKNENASLILASVPAKQESPIKSSFEERNRTFDTLVLQPKKEDSTYTDEDVLAAFDEAEPKCLILNVILRNMDLKTFAVPVLNGIIERMFKIRSWIIGRDPTLLYSFRDYFMKEFKNDYETRHKLKMEKIEKCFLEFKSKFKPSAEILRKSKSDLYSYCCDKCIFYLGYSMSTEESGEYEIKKEFASLVLKIAENYAKIKDDSKPDIVKYFNSRMDKEVKWFIESYIEDNDSDFFTRYSYTLNSCGIFPYRFIYLLRDPCREVKPIQVMMQYFRNLNDKRFNIMYWDLKRLLTDFIDKVHNARKSENAPDDIYLKTFNDFNMKFSDSFDLGFENIRWDPDSIEETSDEFGETLMYSLKHKKGYVKTTGFCISYPKNEKKESDEME